MTKEVFSVYRPPVSSATTPVGSLTLDSVWEEMTDHTLKEQTEKVRSLYSQGKTKEYRDQKGQLLPSATFGGVFDYRSRDQKKLSELDKRGLLSSSSLVIIDIDHISQTGLSLEELRDKLYQDTEIGVRLIFVSPSGDGLKVICKTSAEITNDTTYKGVFYPLKSYVETAYPGVEVDKSGADITRLCFLCYDPLAKIKDSEETFNPSLHPVPEKKSQSPEYTYQEIDSFCNSGEDGIEEIVRRVEESRIDIAPTYGEYYPLCCSFSSLGERGRSLLHRVCRLSPKYVPEDTDKLFTDCLGLQESQSIGYFINLAQRNGINTFDYNNKRGGQPYRPDMTPIHTNQRETPQTSTETPEEKYKDFLSIPALGDIAKTKREGIKTRYKFGKNKGKEEELTLRSGAMTMICGKSSHCKSKLLQNLALQISEDMYNRSEEGSVLFFTYEEELSDVVLQFANIKTNTPGLSQYGTPNTEVIREYLSSGDSARCTRDKKSALQRGLSQFKTLYESGTLRVYYTDKSSQELCEVIRYLSSQIKVKAVFIDYIQLLHKDKFRGDKREEIAEICNDIRVTAIDLGLPIVLSAQLNRLADSPTDMSEDNIAESADITRYANTIVCLWNSYFDNVSKGYKETPEYKSLQSRGFTLGEGGKIYAKITKNRGGTPYIDEILDFTGETGCIPAPEINYSQSSLLDDLPPDDYPDNSPKFYQL